MPTRKAALEHARLIYKCESKKHITPAMDRDHHRKLSTGKTTAKERADYDHGGCEVHVVYVNPGSAPVELPPCLACGGEMVLVEGELPEYAELAHDGNGVIEHAHLQAAQKRRAR